MKLEGVRVLDLSLFLPGPVLTQMMADHGAEVIKLEPLGGEPNRELGPKRDGMTVYFANPHPTSWAATWIWMRWRRA